MLEVKGNVWDVYKDYDAFCITTNGFVKSTGECVMGRGIALECSKRYPQVPKILGSLIKKSGNRVFKLGKLGNSTMCSFPTKHVWWDNSDLSVIEASVKQITLLADKEGWNKVLIPRPGVGNGKLSWDIVKPIVDKLDDRFYIITF